MNASNILPFKRPDPDHLPAQLEFLRQVRETPKTWHLFIRWVVEKAESLGTHYHRNKSDGAPCGAYLEYEGHNLTVTLLDTRSKVQVVYGPIPGDFHADSVFTLEINLDDYRSKLFGPDSVQSTKQ